MMSKSVPRPRESVESDSSSTNVKVYVRVRPMNDQERQQGAHEVVTIDKDKPEVTVHRQSDKSFLFDGVFGAASTQSEIYNGIVAPIVAEVLKGFNCTVFAYGLTGTGKTYTMEGGSVVRGSMPDHWQPNSINAGIIPRAVHHIFNELAHNSTLQGTNEYSVRVSHLELYGEKLIDLLSGADAKEPNLVDDGKTGVRVSPLEEAIVTSADAVCKELKKSLSKRHVRATLSNDASSRSHCVFTVTIHMKEKTPAGEDEIKIGKLNLVDLAGSENIGRSGAVEIGQREAGNINQSLLTLGRVITALTKREQYIPYRESKLTRLLQESLGGKAKTAIVVTVSPASGPIDETISTLEYGNRAMNIKNMPEMNKKMTKSIHMTQLNLELSQAKAALTAAREKNGIYLPPEEFEQLQTDRRMLKEQEGIIELKTKECNEMTTMLTDLQKQIISKSNELRQTNQALVTTKVALSEAEQRCIAAQQKLDDEKALVAFHESFEAKLQQRIAGHIADLDNAQARIVKLHEKIERCKASEAANAADAAQFSALLATRVAELEASLDAFQRQEATAMTNADLQAVEFVNQFGQRQASFAALIGQLKSSLDKSIDDVCAATLKFKQTQTGDFDALTAAQQAHLRSFTDTCNSFIADAKATFAALQSASSEHGQAIESFKANATAASDQARFRVASFAQTQQKYCNELRVSIAGQVSTHRQALSAHMVAARNASAAARAAAEAERDDAIRQISELVTRLVANQTSRDATMLEELDRSVCATSASLDVAAQSMQATTLTMAKAAGDFNDDYAEGASQRAAALAHHEEAALEFVSTVGACCGGADERATEFVDAARDTVTRETNATMQRVESVRAALNEFYVRHNFDLEASKNDHVKFDKSLLEAIDESKQHVATAMTNNATQRDSRKAAQRTFNGEYKASLSSAQQLATSFISRLRPIRSTGGTPSQSPLRFDRAMPKARTRSDILEMARRDAALDANASLLSSTGASPSTTAATSDANASGAMLCDNAALDESCVSSASGDVELGDGGGASTTPTTTAATTTAATTTMTMMSSIDEEEAGASEPDDEVEERRVAPTATSARGASSTPLVRAKSITTATSQSAPPPPQQQALSQPQSLQQQQQQLQLLQATVKRAAIAPLANKENGRAPTISTRRNASSNAVAATTTTMAVTTTTTTTATTVPVAPAVAVLAKRAPTSVTALSVAGKKSRNV